VIALGPHTHQNADAELDPVAERRDIADIQHAGEETLADWAHQIAHRLHPLRDERAVVALAHGQRHAHLEDNAKLHKPLRLLFHLAPSRPSPRPEWPR